MGIYNGVGQSDETPTKQRHFAGLLSIQMRAAKGVMSNPKYTWCNSDYYQYFDLYCGSGTSVDGEPGSPLIFLRKVEEIDIPYRAYFVDKNAASIERLRDLVPAHHRRYCQFYAQDNRMAIREHLRAMRASERSVGRRMGLIYADPNHGKDINWDVLQWMNRVEWHERTDIAIYVGATSIKRWRSNPRCNLDYYLTEKMAEVGKKKWLVRLPSGRNQWTFLFGTKWAKMPTWEREGFYDITSSTGKRILRALNYTKDELGGNGDASQPPLLDL